MQKSTPADESEEAGPSVEIENDEPISLFDIEDDFENELKPKIGEYWKVKNGAHFLYAKISKENPLEVMYFSPSVKGSFFSLNDTPYSACREDLHEKIDPPDVIQKGRHRKFYLF